MSFFITFITTCKSIVILRTLLTGLSYLLLVSCNFENNKTSSISLKNDSITYYYNQSKSKQLNYQKRLFNINKAYKYYDDSKVDSLGLAILYKKSKIHFDLEEYDSVNYYNKLLFKYSKDINNIYYTARYHYLQSYYQDLVLSRMDSAFYHINKAKDYYSQLKDSSNVGKKNINIARLHYETGDYHSSIESSLNALKYLSFQRDIRYISSVHNVLAKNYEELELLEDAIKNYKKAISLTSFTVDKSIYKNNLATVYNDLNKYDESINILESINLDSIQIPIEKALIIDNLAYTKWLQNPTKNVENQLNKALCIRESKNDVRGLVDSYEHLANYFAIKKPQKSLFYSNELIKASRLLNHPKGELKALKIIMKISPEDTGSRNRYIQLKDSLELANLKVRNQYAKIKYDNKQALEDNEILRQKNNYQKSQKTVYALLATIALLLLISYFVYSLQKRKQTKLKHRQEKLQEVYKTEAGISKKIHDELANGIYHVMIQAENENTSFSEDSVDALEKLYKKARNISHQISEIDTNEGFEEELKGMLEDYHTVNTSVVVSGIDTVSWKLITGVKKETIYRVLNELMVNMKKHSQANLIILKFSTQKGKISISYSDDGVGINETQLVFGTGLKNVENRIINIQGTFIFETNTNKGLRILIMFPS